MEKKKDRSMYFIIGSLGLLFLAVVVTSIVNKNQSESAVDIRAKAGATQGLKYEAVVASIEPDGSLKVDNVMPYNNTESNFGSWTVLPIGSLSLTEFTPGTTVIITINPESFNVQAHTMRAKSISKK